MKKQGFTILEVLIAMALIAMISAAVFINLNPASQLAKARNATRSGAVLQILNAIGLRKSDNRGVFETGCAAGIIPTTITQIGNGVGNYDIEPCLVPAFMPPPMPYDPLGGTAEATGYNIQRDATTGRVTVSAPDAELGAIISETR